jgi:hypothetical protein
MLVNQMTAPLLPVSTHFLAAFDEAGESFLAAVALRRHDGIVVFGDVQVEEVGCREVCAAGGAAVAVGLGVVGFVVGV